MCDSLSPDVSGLICHDMMGNINKVREELDFLFSNIRDQGGIGPYPSYTATPPLRFDFLHIE